MQMTSNTRGALFSLVGFSLFAFGDAGYKYLSGHYSVYSIIFLASLVALSALLGFAACTCGVREALKTNKLKMHLLRGLLVTAQVILIVIAFGHLSLAKTYAIVFVAPFLAALLSILLLRETIRVKQWLAIALGFGGVMIVLRPGIIPLEPAVFAALGSAFLFALTNVMVRVIGMEGEARLAFPAYAEIAILPVAGVMALPGFVWPAPFDAAIIIFIGITAAAGMYCISRAFAEAPPAVAAPFHYIQMLWAVGLGWLIFGDGLDLWVGIGGTVITLSGVWLIWQERPGAVKGLSRQTPPP